MASPILIFRAFKFVVLLSTLSKGDIRWAILKSLPSNYTLMVRQMCLSKSLDVVAQFLFASGKWLSQSFSVFDFIGRHVDRVARIQTAWNKPQGNTLNTTSLSFKAFH